jgi:hypothetical protein
MALAMKHMTEIRARRRARCVPSCRCGWSGSCCSASRRTRRGASRPPAALLAELQRPRSDTRLRSRKLAVGDSVLEDAAEASEWALVLQSREQKTGWSEGMALRFEDRFYRLDRTDAPAERAGRWTYRFVAWPEGVVFRKLVDYEHDVQERASKPPPLHERLTRLLSGGKP